MTLKPFDPFFPTTLATRPTPGDSNTFQNQVVGGLNVRDSVALEIFKAVMANPPDLGSKVTSENLMEISFNLAERFIEKANGRGGPTGVVE